MWNFDNKTPIYLQLLERLIFLIVTGHYAPGTKIPSVRDLAIESKTNPNTVQKALQELEQMGFITTQRTNGKFVTENKEIIQSYFDQLIEGKIDTFLSELSALGISKDMILKKIETKGNL